MIQQVSREALPDVLQPGLKVVFCGTAAGHKSARVGAYYAGPGNAFWPTLYAVGVTPRPLAPLEFRTVVRYGIGLTDLNKHESGMDADLSATGFDPASLHAKIARFQPRVLAFTSKRAAQEFTGQRVAYGRQPGALGKTAIFVLPSPSGAARRWWDVTFWQAVADFVNAGGQGDGR
ncbi:MAG: mismatch-specific DNA-glycosylase [Anaerolineae bacterium]|nr:mismatch-specific DNA-glycosylase [Anaerolineae bacterium]